MTTVPVAPSSILLTISSIIFTNGSIILTRQDGQTRIDLLRGTIKAGNDNKELNQELQQLTNQDVHTNNKTRDDLYNDLKNLIPILKKNKCHGKC